MADLTKAILDQFKTAMVTAMPDRVVTRTLKDFSDRTRVELQAGVFTIQVQGQSTPLESEEFLDLAIVGQIELPEKTDPSLIEDAELAMIHQLRRFTENLQGAQVLIKKWVGSQQLDAPYGWVRAELKLGPFLFCTSPDDTELAEFLTLNAQYDFEPFQTEAERLAWQQEPPDYTQTAPDLTDQQQVRDPL